MKTEAFDNLHFTATAIKNSNSVPNEQFHTAVDIHNNIIGAGSM